MDEFLKWLNDNQWLNIIFLTLAILSIIVSIYLYIKSKKRKIPVYDKRSINVISDKIKKIGDIEIQYKGGKVDNLTVSKIAIWNNGNDTVNDTDQAPTDKLRIEIDEDFSILESEVIFCTSDTNNIRIVQSSNKIEILFDYLDPNDGGIIKVIHTGTNSSDINLLGTFKGSDKLKRINSGLFNIGVSLVLSLPIIGKLPNSKKEKRIMAKAFSWIVLGTGIGFGTAFFWSNVDLTNRIVFSIMGVAYGSLGLFLVFNSKSMPKGFEVFYDDE